MSWQIQAKLKTGTEWEPISVESRNEETGERRFHYNTSAEAIAAVRQFDDMEHGLPHLVVKLATGKPKLLEQYEVRFVEIEETAALTLE